MKIEFSRREEEEEEVFSFTRALCCIDIRDDGLFMLSALHPFNSEYNIIYVMR